MLGIILHTCPPTTRCINWRTEGQQSITLFIMLWHMSRDRTLHNMMPTPRFNSLPSSTPDIPKQVSPSNQYKLIHYRTAYAATNTYYQQHRFLPYNDLLLYVILIIFIFYNFSNHNIRATWRWWGETETCRSICNIT